ncbi:hypothetical protein evm_007723 [Chilo suppressalis]|nr:hypothetical protein evm_007723 [Chilo suppressalis]
MLRQRYSVRTNSLFTSESAVNLKLEHEFQITAANSAVKSEFVPNSTAVLFTGYTDMENFRNQRKQSKKKSRGGILTENELNCIRIEKAKSKIKKEDCTELSKISHKPEDVSSSFTVTDSVNGMTVKSQSEHKDNIKECHIVSKELLALNKRIEKLKKLNCKYNNQILRLCRFEAMENQIMGTCKEETKEVKAISNVNGYNKKLEELVKQFYLDDDHSRLSANKIKYIIENGEKQKIRLSDVLRARIVTLSDGNYSGRGSGKTKKTKRKTFGKTTSSLTNRESVLNQITDASVFGEVPGDTERQRTATGTVQKGGKSVSFWGDKKTVTIDGIVRPFRVNHGHKFVLVDDNAPAHRAQRVNAALREYEITRLDWPAGSPGLNPIEHAWDALKRAVWNRKPPPQTVPQLREAAVQEWDRLPQEMLDKLILSMPRRISACVRARGVILY